MKLSALRNNGFANVLALSMGIVIQIVSVPLMTSAFGVENYGTWVMLLTVPIIFVLLDLGMHAAATGDMTMKFSAGLLDQSSRVYSTILGATLAICLVATTFMFFLLIIAAWYWKIFSVEGDLFWLVAIALIYAGSWLLSGVPMAGLKGNGCFVQGVIGYQCISFVENIIALLVAFCTNSLIYSLLTLCVVRCIGTACFFYLAARLVPHLKNSFFEVNRAELKRLLPIGLSASAVPIAVTLGLQGVVLISGALLGPAMAGVYSTLRTASRVPLTAVSMINLAIVPELSKARGLGDKKSEADCWRLNGYIILVLLLPTAVLFGFFGTELIEFWSAGVFQLSRPLVGLAASTMFFHGVWYFRMQLFIACHDHIGLGRFPLFGSVLSLVLVYFVAAEHGLIGALAVTTGVELVICSLIFFARRVLG